MRSLTLKPLKMNYFNQLANIMDLYPTILNPQHVSIVYHSCQNRTPSWRGQNIHK